jgi:DNA-binding NarL/FixJ family response regulator
MTLESRVYNALIIDDHPLISEAYKSAFHFFEKKNESVSFDIAVCHDCDSAIKKIEEIANQETALDIVFLDISLPPSEDGTILSGEDLGLKLNELIPEARIIVSTTFNDNYRIHSIFKNINPDGFLIKNDITPKELLFAIEEVLTDPPYYSKTVMKLLRKQVSSDMLLDHIDRKILYQLSIGTRIKDMTDMVPLSAAGIQKRKRHLMQVFDISGVDDKELVHLAKEKGFI